MNADFPALESPVSDAIGILFRFAEEALDTALSFHFQEAKEHYYSRLGKVDQLFANSPNEETEELRAVVKLLQEQHLFYFQYDTFKMPKPGVYPPTVEDQEQLIELMKMLAIKLGLNDCAKKIGSILYDPNGEETQDIFGGPAFVPRESCTSHHHIQMSKLAAFVAHSPPDPKVLYCEERSKKLLMLKYTFFSVGSVLRRKVRTTRKTLEQVFSLCCFSLLE